MSFHTKMKKKTPGHYMSQKINNDNFFNPNSIKFIEKCI